MARIPESKTAVPGLPPWFVSRPDLRRRLAGADDAHLVAVIAPAGSGKTMALAEWTHHDAVRATAWVTLDQDDADPRRLWAAVVASLVATGVVPSGSALHRLEHRGLAVPDGRDGEDITDEVLDALDAQRPAVRLVLDDVHTLSGSRAGTDALARLLRRRPGGVRLVLAGRSDPAVALPRLRLDGQLCELRAEDLRFTPDDATALLTASGVDLTPEQVALLHRRTDGWAAGLRLAVLALRHTGDRAAFLARFSGDERSVADYLTGEVLSALPERVRDLLQDLSVCDRLPVALCAALTGRTDAASELEDLERGIAMVARTAPAEYRVHALLRSHLEADLARHRPAHHRRLHAAAARWWAGRREAAHALRHAESAGDPGLTGEIVRRLGVGLLLAGDVAPLRRALGTVGARGLEEDPYLALLGALAHLASAELPAAAADLDHARGAWPARGEPALETLRAGTEMIAAGLGVSTGHTDPPRVPGPVPAELEALFHTGRAVALVASSDPGDAAAARAAAGRSVVLARAHGFGYLEVNALSLVAVATAVEGDLPATTEAAEDAAAAAARSGPDGAAAGARAAALGAYADLLRGSPDRARARCAAALAPGASVPPGAAYTLHVVHGSALGDGADPGDRAAGLAEARAARAALGATTLPDAAARALAVLEHRAALALGNPAAAADVVAWLTVRTGEVAETTLMRAWAEAASGRPAAARALAVPLLAGGGLLRVHGPVEVHLLDAEASLQAGDVTAGRAALDAALGEARALDLVRPFTLAGPRSRALLGAPADVPGSAGAGDFADRVATACAVEREDGASPLSERELVVLTLLPSLLNAPAMADELVVSVNTVKSQIRSIYAKLGVSTRREAVSRAQDRGLLV